MSGRPLDNGRWAWAACLVLLAATTAAVLFVAGRALLSLRGQRQAVSTYVWPIVQPSTVVFGTFSSFADELARTPHRYNTGVILPPRYGRPLCSMPGVFVPCPADAEMVVMVMQPRGGDSSGDVPSTIGMLVEVSGLTRNQNGVLLPADGSVKVRAFLSPAQAFVVRNEGLPPSLVRDLVDTARSHGWRPIERVGEIGPMSPIFEVDPTPHFLAIPAATEPQAPAGKGR